MGALRMAWSGSLWDDGHINVAYACRWQFRDNGHVGVHALTCVCSRRPSQCGKACSSRWTTVTTTSVGRVHSSAQRSPRNLSSRTHLETRRLGRCIGWQQASQHATTVKHSLHKVQRCVMQRPALASSCDNAAGKVLTWCREWMKPQSGHRQCGLMRPPEVQC